MVISRLPTIIIAGPTASGKTDFSYDIGSKVPIEIINADVGQFYTPCTVGTAKPKWLLSYHNSIPHHFFDIFNEPQYMDVTSYRKKIILLVQKVKERGNIPVIVGGSLFYLKSLYFPPVNIANVNVCAGRSCNRYDSSEPNSWELLHKIDPKRAAQIHENDTYRINRAFDILRLSGRKPSEYVPDFSLPFNSLFVFLSPPRELLFERINKRTCSMINQQYGWIDEVASLIGTSWENFLKKKKLIGYLEIFEWIENGKNISLLNDLVKKIQNRTKKYAKRQLTFWNSFKKELNAQFKNSSYRSSIIELGDVDGHNLSTFMEKIYNF